MRDLQSQINEIDCKPGLAVDYDSGWIAASSGDDIVLTHNLGTRDLMVYIYYRMEDPTIPSADFKATHNIRAHEVYWFASEFDEVTIDFPNTDYAWQEIRVLLWEIPA